MEYFECYAASYARARAKFLEAAAGSGGEVRSFIHPAHQAPDGSPLAVDVACFGDAKAPRQALFVSGTHGQEGFSGSAVQIGWMMQGGPSRLPPGVGAVLVHGLNPYGFAHFTRTTENNVDLNRNFIDRTAGPAPANPHYETLHGDLMIRQWTDAENARVDAAMAAFTERHGRDALFDTLARGQYVHADGLMFGGRDREWSNRTLETVIQETLPAAEKVAFIDWHTGIGEYGKPFFLCFNEGALFQRACDWWGKENVDGVRPHGMERPSYTGLVFNGVQRFLGNREMCGAVIEFGTRGVNMRRVLRLDQWLRRQDGLDEDVRAGLQADMMDAFCPFDGQWRKDTLAAGLKLTDQALAGLAAW
ncbi:M14 family metallopeptidase [Reyranella sp.]|uniref:M14 family metallopeptidase n=1 Tax=Reyranella sp. TaxID=1929291 RepID=UPI003BAC169D